MIVCFDMYGTLLDLQALQEAVRPFSPMVEAVCDEWRKRQLQLANASSATGRYVNFDRVTLTALHEIAPRFHMRLEPTDQKRLIDAWAQLTAFDDVIPALDELRKRRVPAMVMTNAVESTARNALAFAGILDRFDRVISGDTARSYKPNPAVYAQLLGERIQADDVVFVSSNDWDAIGARQAGFHSIWVNRRRLNSGPKAERTIGDLREIEIVLNELSPH